MLIAVIFFIIGAQFSDLSLTKIDTIYIVSIVLLVNEGIKAIIADDKSKNITYDKEFFKYASKIFGFAILFIAQISLAFFCFYVVYNRYMHG
jgi:hypothetical protein